MADMKAQFTTFKTQVIEAFNSYRIEMNQMMEAYKTETSAEIAVALAEITTTMNESLERYNEEIKAWVSEYFQNVNVWNPVIGMETTINKAISDLYDLFRGPTAITCAEFDALVGYNCSIFDAMGYTAKEFDIGFKTIIENN